MKYYFVIDGMQFIGFLRASERELNDPILFPPGTFYGPYDSIEEGQRAAMEIFDSKAEIIAESIDFIHKGHLLDDQPYLTEEEKKYK